MKKQSPKAKTPKSNAFTLIEAMVFLFIFSIITTTFYSVITLGTGYIMEAKNRLGALALANEKMEIIHNLEYDDIGTITGIPPGSIVESEDVVSGGKTFHVKTIVQYIDDDFDGVLPADSIPEDYKRAKITVSWEGFEATSRSVYLVSDFTPPSLEVNSGDGILVINIIDGAGVGVPQAQVHIVNDYISPEIDLTQNTNNSGILMFPGAKPSQWGYAITVSKNGYETVSTVDPDSVAYAPKDSHASVIAGSLNTASVIIDKLADLKIKSADYLGSPIPGLNFHIKGGREIGTEIPSFPLNFVYDLDSDESTGSGGEKNFDDRSPGRQFFLSNIESISEKTLIGAYPIIGFESATSTYEFSLLPDESKTVEIKFADNNTDSLLVKVVRDDDNSPVNNAQVKLTNVDGYDETVSTSFDGVAFFPVNGEPFLPGAYTLEVTESGFQNYSSSVDIDKLTIEEVKLDPN